MTDITPVAPPLTRRQAREIERRTGQRPIAQPVAAALAPMIATSVAPAPATTVFDTGRIEPNERLALVSVLPTEIIERVVTHPAPVATHASVEGTTASAFGRPASIRAARPVALVARARRRTVAGLGVAASAAVLATAVVAVPGGLGAVDQQASQAALVTADGIADTEPAQLDAETATATAETVLVAAPEVAADRGQYSVASFDAEAVEELVVADSAAPATAGGADVSGIGAIADSMVGGGAGWLCTDFTRAVYAEAGIDLPGNVVSAQAAGGTQTDDPQVGDLVVFTSGHIGIYAGGGMMWDNPGFESSVVGWQNVYRSIDVIGSGYYFVTYR